jgi:hypothetical protein
MRVRVIYRIQNEATGNEDQLSDMLNWPDIESLSDAESHIGVYLDQKWGQDKYELVQVEEV